jgi:hypothetical protein
LIADSHQPEERGDAYRKEIGKRKTFVGRNTQISKEEEITNEKAF